MAITIYKQPLTKVSAYRPVTWEVQSDRVADTNWAVTLISDSGGDSGYYGAVFSDSDFRIGDIILPNVTNSYYNILQTILGVVPASGFIRTDLPYPGYSSTGSITRSNDNIKIKGQLFAGLNEEIKIISQTLNGGTNTIVETSTAHGLVAGDFIEITNTPPPIETPINAAFTAGAGNLGAGTYWYRVSAFRGNGETLASVQTSFILTAPGGINVNWNTIIGATAYVIYGRTSGAELKLDAVVAVTTWLDNGLITPSPSDVMPAKNTTSYNGCWEVYSIVSTTQFRILRVYIDNFTGNIQKLSLIGTKIQTPVIYVADTIFRFDFSNFLQSLLSFDLPLLTGFDISSPNNNSIKNYLFNFIELFNDVDGLLQEHDKLNTSDNYKQVTNIMLQHEDNQSLTVFEIETSAKRFLTNKPYNKFIPRNSYVQLSFITDFPLVKCFMRKYKIAGGYDDVYTADKIIYKNSGTVRFDTNSSEIYFQYSIKLYNANTGVQISELNDFPLFTACSDDVTIWWLNRLGRFDNYTFTGSKIAETKIKSSIFKKRIADGFAVSDRGKTTLNSDIESNYEANSKYITQLEADWLIELLTSPIIFLQKNTDLIPIISNSSVIRTRESDKLLQIKFEYSLANDILVQQN